MKKLKLISNVFWLTALVLSHYTCAVVAFNYCNMFYLGKYEGFSAPPDTAFLLSIPYLVCIIVCIAVAIILRRKSLMLENK